MKDSQNIIKHPSFVITKTFNSFTEPVWYVDKLNYEDIRKISSGKGAKLAIIDSGIDEHVEELQGKIFDTYDATKEAGSPKGDHGTHVAGITAGNNVGLFPDLQVGDFKALTAREGFGSTDWLIYALEEAEIKGYEVVSASLGTDEADRFFKKGIEKYTSNPKNILVCAAGNSGNLTDYPARFASNNKSVISVGAAGIDNGNIYIPLWSDRKVVTVVAPGVDVFSSISKSRYATMSGTSMATPFVSAMIAVAKSIRPEITSNEIHEALFYTSSNVVEGNDIDGAGFIDIASFLRKIKSIDIKEVAVAIDTNLTWCKRIKLFIKRFK